MRRLWVAVAMVMAGSGCSASSASDGSAAAGQRDYPVGAFDRVQLAGHQDVRVSVGGSPSVRAEGSEMELERLEIEVVDGRLRIGSKRGSWTSSGRVTVYVTAPSLKGVDVAGSGNMEVGALRTQQFRGDVAGSGNLVLQGIEADAAAFDIAGSGNVRAAGRARAIELAIAGSGAGRLNELQTESARISIAGSGDAEVRASSTADVSIIGSGNVGVRGGARCNVQRLGSGAVRCG